MRGAARDPSIYHPGPVFHHLGRQRRQRKSKTPKTLLNQAPPTVAGLFLCPGAAPAPGLFLPPGGDGHPYMILKMVLCAHVPHKTPEALGCNGFKVGTLQFIICPEVPPCAPAAAGDRTTAHPERVGGQNFAVVKFFLRSKFCLAVKILSDQASDFPSTTSSTMTSAYFSSSCSGVTSSPRGLPGVSVTSCLSVYPKWFFPRKMPDTGLTLPLSI